MPNIIIKVPEGAFDPSARAKLAKATHAAAKAVEGWGDDPRQEALTWVLVEEVPAGNFYMGGADQTSRVIPIIVFCYPPAGVINAEGRAKVVGLIHEAASNAKQAEDARPVMTSVMVWDVADGTWGANGKIWHLGDFAKAAGYKHLQHLVKSS
jgi:phenylpyruvate tautomerase PptA (4-oxalocrotonate tautomerase family)